MKIKTIRQNKIVDDETGFRRRGTPIAKKIAAKYGKSLFHLFCEKFQKAGNEGP